MRWELLIHLSLSFLLLLATAMCSTSMRCLLGLVCVTASSMMVIAHFDIYHQAENVKSKEQILGRFQSQ